MSLWHSYKFNSHSVVSRIGLSFSVTANRTKKRRPKHRRVAAKPAELPYPFHTPSPIVLKFGTSSLNLARENGLQFRAQFEPDCYTPCMSPLLGEKTAEIPRFLPNFEISGLQYPPYRRSEPNFACGSGHMIFSSLPNFGFIGLWRHPSGRLNFKFWGTCATSTPIKANLVSDRLMVYYIVPNFTLIGI